MIGRTWQQLQEGNMKTEEDEAFDDLARRQGDWGGFSPKMGGRRGGFPAKRAMAADKFQENVPLYVSKTAFRSWREFASDYERGFIDGMQKQAQSSVDKAVNQIAQPAQEPVACTDERMCVPCYTGQGTCDCTQQFKFWSVTGRYERQAFASLSGAEAYCKGLNTAHPDENYVVRPLWETPPFVQPAQEPDMLTIAYQSGFYDGKKAALAGREWNFCERCGKRTADLTVIHTCTPPQEKNND
jgi:hypothetical protein